MATWIVGIIVVGTLLLVGKKQLKKIAKGQGCSCGCSHCSSSCSKKNL